MRDLKAMESPYLLGTGVFAGSEREEGVPDSGRPSLFQVVRIMDIRRDGPILGPSYQIGSDGWGYDLIFEDMHGNG